MSFHRNEVGFCPGCEKLFDRYPNFDPPLRRWFNYARMFFPEFHISEAGRGKVDQEADFARGASRAHWGKSAHNYNAAIDTFFQDPTAPGHYLVTRERMEEVFAKCPLNPTLEWYGEPGESFPEIPHIQVRNWRGMVVPNALKLVETA